MTNYRRNFLPGGSYFFTGQSGRSSACAFDRSYCLIEGSFSPGAGTTSLRDRSCRDPPGSPARDLDPARWRRDFATRRRLIKSGFSHALPGGERVSASRAANRERGIWQRRYWEHTLRDEDDFFRHLNYIHFNPVKHGHTIHPQDWPYSSFRRWVRLGAYPVDWAGDSGDGAGSFGEK